MTLEDLGNLGEFVGAIGVVVSLVYLALQIRQNTRHVSESNRSLRLNELNATAEAFSRFRYLVVPHPEVAELLQRGSTDGTALTPADRRRFALLMQELFFSYQALYLRAEEKVIPWGSWESTLAMIAGLLKSPGIRGWWSHQQAIFEPGFVEAIERAGESA